MGDLTLNFSAKEFECPCCGKSEMRKETLERLQRLRGEYNKPFSPVYGGGFRCERFDGKQGTHTLGRAIDPGIPREDMYEFLALAIKYDFTGIGIKQKGGRWQMHIDDCEGTGTNHLRPWIWTY